MLYQFQKSIDRKIKETEIYLESLKSESATDAIARIEIDSLEDRLEDLVRQKKQLQENSDKERIMIRLVGENTNSGKVSIDLFSKLLMEFQQLSNSIANQLLFPESKGHRVKKDAKRLARLEISEVFKGSFGFKLENTCIEQQGLGKTINGKIFMEIYDLFSFGSDEKRLEEISSHLGYSTMKHFKEFLTEIDNDLLEIELNITNQYQENYCRYLSRDDIGKASKNLENLVFNTEEEYEYDVTLVGLNTDRNNFEAIIETEDKTKMKGELDPKLATLIIEDKLINKKCRIKITKFEEKNLITHKEVTRIVATELNTITAN